MKKTLAILLALLMALALCAPCLAEAEAVTPDVLDALVELQPLGIVSSECAEGSIATVAFLQAVMQNRTDVEITDALVGFAAWDAEGQPVKISAMLSMAGDAFVARVNFEDIALAPGETYGEDSGLRIGTDLGIETCRAIVISYDDAEGGHWENPYFLNWCEMYEEKPFDAASSVSVPASEEELDAARNLIAEREASRLTTDEMLAEIDQQPVRVVNTAYSAGKGSALSGGEDMLQAILQNDSQDTIQSVVVAFVAWDADGQPVEIKQSLEGLINADYTLRLVTYDDVNIAPGGSYGNNSGFAVDPDSNIAQFKAIVFSYETTSGETWENPLFDQWAETYRQVPLEGASEAPSDEPAEEASDAE